MPLRGLLEGPWGHLGRLFEASGEHLGGFLGAFWSLLGPLGCASGASGGLLGPPWGKGSKYQFVLPLLGLS